MFSAKIVILLAAVAVCYGAPNAKFSNKRLKINGGADVKIEDYPFVVSVQWVRNVHGCTGVIIKENWVLTSAGCVVENATMVAVGTSDVRRSDNVFVNIEAGFAHDDYSEMEAGPNDIGLFKLSEALTFNDKVQPVKLPTQGQEFDGTAVVMGFGGNRVDALNFNTLKAVPDVTLVSNDVCNKNITKLFPDQDIRLDNDSNLCTLNEASNICYGDLGGPLYQNGTVIGTATWFANPCGLRGFPNVFTKISNFADWINKTITENS